MRLLFILSFAPLLFSFKFNPMSQSIELAEDQKSAQFTVENDTPETMAIELTVRERIMDDFGKETNPKVEGMTIFPPQMIIPSKEKRTVRVTWNGGKVESERAFRVIAEQLPLKVDEKTKRKSGIQMLMRYMAALYVNPKDSEPKISTLIQKVTASELTLLVTNDGNKHQVLMKPTITFKKSDKKWTLKENDLTGLAGENVLAKSKRIFTIKNSQQVSPDAETSIKLDE